MLSQQRKFFKKMWQERLALNDDPLIFAIKLTLSNRLRTRTYISQLINGDRDDVDITMEKLKRDMCLGFLQQNNIQRN